MRTRHFCWALPLVAALFAASCRSGVQTPNRVSGASDVPEGIAAFRTLHRVLVHPRCLNCHPRDDRPRQGDDGHPHHMGVVRGADGGGAVGMRCTGCHSVNNQINGVPGVEGWALPPSTMGWIGVDARAICLQLKDPKRNGGRTLEATLEHLTEHPLVLWAWRPGLRPGGEPRTPPSVPLEDFKHAARTWVERKAPCPTASQAARWER